MRANICISFIVLSSLMMACSGNPDMQTSVVKGQITVADSVDSSKDFGGIEVTIIRKDSANAPADTLFHEVTDTTGHFKGEASFAKRSQYPLIVSRNHKNLGQAAVILADKDTLTISAELPGFRPTFSIQSREHDALKTYQRVDRSFQRVAAYANAGRIKGDSLGMELKKWSGIFWQVYQKNKGTMASQLAASESVRLLQGLDNQAMMHKIRTIQDDDELVGIAATYGKEYLAQQKGLHRALGYLDSLQKMTQKKDMNMRIQMERIKLLYDSAKVKNAKADLETFQQSFKENKKAQSWADAISYDLNYLSPGDSIPSFSFEADGRTISRDSLLGTPYILEISTLANQLYQEQYDRTIVIHSIYKNYGLQVVTIPLDQSQVTIDAFFSERVKAWPVASANTFNADSLLTKFNVRVIPTRFLVNRKGNIVRKYIGREYQDIIQGIQTLTKNEKPTS